MKRLTSYALASLVGLALPACGKKPDKPKDSERAARAEASPAKAEVPPPPPLLPGASAAFESLAAFVPADASHLVGIDARNIVKAKMWATAEAALQSSALGTGGKKVLLDCGLAVDAVDALLLAGGPKEAALVTIHAAGVGTEKRVRCLSKGFSELDGGVAPELERVEVDGVVRLVPKTNPELIAVMTSGDSLALVTPNWVDAVAARVKGDSDRLDKGPMAKLRSRVALAKHLWFVGAWPAQANDLVGGTPLDAATDLHGFVDISTGLALKVDIGLENRAQAASAMDSMRTTVNEQRPLLAMLTGLSDTTFDKIELEAVEERVSMGVSLTPAEVGQIQAAVGRMLGASAVADESPSANAPIAREDGSGAAQAGAGKPAEPSEATEKGSKGPTPAKSQG